MTPSDTDGLVRVEQCDRAVAATMLALNEPVTADLVRRGKRDNLHLVQTLARHRILASLTPATNTTPTSLAAPSDRDIVLQFIRGEKNRLGSHWHSSIARDAFARFEASLTPATDERQGWQDIATFDEPTASSSGCGVLVAEADGTVGEAYFRAFGDDDDGWWWANTSRGDYPEPQRPAPVAWMPLPPAPKDRSDAE